jgi:hypothetical protein
MDRQIATPLRHAGLLNSGGRVMISVGGVAEIIFGVASIL